MTKAQKNIAKKKTPVGSSKVSPAGKRAAGSAKGTQTGSLPTPKEIAEWMVEQINVNEQLLQVDAVAAIKDLFGKAFVYRSEIGELSIDRRILYQFRKLTKDDVVWATHHGGGFYPDAHWRKRERSDSPGRTQYIEG
jgi:hypothetical protein